MALGKPLHLRLFLEGQEVPVISAQVQATLFAPASAAIQVVPLDEVLSLKPRTMVHLFFLEEPLVSSVKGELVRQNLVGARVTNEKGVAQDTALSDQVYKLLFCGELVGFSFVKTPMSRAVILQCLDHSNYWDFLQAMMLDYGPNGNAFVHKASLYAADTSLFSSIPTQSPAEKLRSWITSKPKTPGLTDITGLAGGIVSMMEIMGGLRGYRLGVNDFFTIAELRNHILAQVVAEDGDATSQRLLDHKVFFEWLSNNLSTGGGLLTLRDMFKLLCQYVYYTIVPCPVAKYEPSATNAKVTIPARNGSLSASPYFDRIHTTAEHANVTLQTTDLPKQALSQIVNDVQTNIASIINSTPPKIQNMPSDVSVKATLLYNNLRSYLSGYDSLTASAREAAREKSQSLVANFLSAFDSAGKKIVTTQGTTNYVAKQQDRLRTQIFRPDCFMSAPPTCNVIFPEQYSQLTYDRSFLTEVTRVEIDVHNELAYGTNPRDANTAQLTALHLMQPDIHNFTLEVAKHIKDKWRILMDHELHTGIIAKEEWLPDSFSSGWLRKGNDTSAQKKMKAAQLSWSQKTGLHHFFKYRIGPRTMSITGRFMPYLVAGFPTLVLQRPLYVDIPDTTEDQILQLIRTNANPAQGPLFAPPQFLGMIESLTHMLGQDGGHTSVSLSHCRSHLGIDDEFIGVVLDRIRITKSKSQLVRWTLNIQDALQNERLKNFLRDCTPQSAEASQQAALTAFNLRTPITSSATYDVTQISDGVTSTVSKSVSVQSVSETTQSPSGTPNLTSESPSPLGAVGTTVQVPTPPGKITVGSKGLKGGTIKLIEVLPPYAFSDTGGSRFYDAILVTEEVQVPYDANTDPRVPVEYVVKPSWLSTSYDNENVGPKVYQKFFGCGSIVDQIITSDVGQVPSAVPIDGLDTTSDEDVRALQQRLKTIDQKRSLLSIEVAVNFIAYLYGKVRSEHLDVEEFVESFTRRPVASKKDILGSYDLDLAVSGATVTTTAGTLGFHSLSIHPKTIKAGNLTGLLDNPVMRMARMDGGTKRAVAASYDVRAQKLEKVEDYLNALSKGSRGFVG